MDTLKRYVLGITCIFTASCGEQPGPLKEETAIAEEGIAEPNEVLAEITIGVPARAFLPIGDAFVELPYVNVNGLAVYGGDMIVGGHEEVRKASAIFRAAAEQGEKASDLTIDAASRKTLGPNLASALLSIQGFGPLGRRWPTKTIPYRIDGSITNLVLKNGIAGAIADWNSTGLVNFVPFDAATEAVKTATNTLIFRDAAGDKFSCSAFVGHQAKASQQTISLNPAWAGLGPAGAGKHGGCRRGSIVHEIGHALGLDHEHMRDDRATYLAVASVVSDDDDNYGIKRNGEKHTGYDLCSIMHYGDRKDGAKWFDLTEQGKKDLQACQSDLANQTAACTKVGQRCQLSPRDVEAIRKRMLNATDA